MKRKFLRKKVEAVLFTTGKFLDSEEIARLCDLDSVGFVRDALEELKEDYEKRDTALNIINQGNKWKLTIIKDYFVTSEKYSRTKILRATQKFYDYFDIVEDHLKQKMGQKQDETQEA